MDTKIKHIKLKEKHKHKIKQTVFLQCSVLKENKNYKVNSVLNGVNVKRSEQVQHGKIWGSSQAAAFWISFKEVLVQKVTA